MDEVETPTWALAPAALDGEPALPAGAHPAQTSSVTALAVPNAHVLTTL